MDGMDFDSLFSTPSNPAYLTVLEPTPQLSGGIQAKSATPLGSPDKLNVLDLFGPPESRSTAMNSMAGSSTKQESTSSAMDLVDLFGPAPQPQSRAAAAAKISVDDLFGSNIGQNITPAPQHQYGQAEAKISDLDELFGGSIHPFTNQIHSSASQQGSSASVWKSFGDPPQVLTAETLACTAAASAIAAPAKQANEKVGQKLLQAWGAENNLHLAQESDDSSDTQEDDDRQQELTRSKSLEQLVQQQNEAHAAITIHSLDKGQQERQHVPSLREGHATEAAEKAEALKASFSAAVVLAAQKLSAENAAAQKAAAAAAAAGDKRMQDTRKGLTGKELLAQRKARKQEEEMRKEEEQAAAAAAAAAATEQRTGDGDKEAGCQGGGHACKGYADLPVSSHASFKAKTPAPLLLEEIKSQPRDTSLEDESLMRQQAETAAAVGTIQCVAKVGVSRACGPVARAVTGGCHALGGGGAPLARRLQCCRTISLLCLRKMMLLKSS
jgi:hypothetical protein